MWVRRTSTDALFMKMLFLVDYMSEMFACTSPEHTHTQVLILTLTFGSFLDLECNRVSGGLQKVDGLAQRFSLETHVIDGQNTVTDMKSTSPLHIKSHVKVR